MFPTFSSLSEFLVWLASAPGALVVAGLLVAYILERFEVWHNLAHDIKSAVTLALAVGVSYLAEKYLNTDIVAGNQELNQMFSLIVYYLGNQLGYKRYFKKELK